MPHINPREHCAPRIQAYLSSLKSLKGGSYIVLDSDNGGGPRLRWQLMVDPDGGSGQCLWTMVASDCDGGSS